MPVTNVQEAPFPVELEGLVARLSYKAGWRFWLEDAERGQGCSGLTLMIQITTPDAYRPDALERTVRHLMPVPAAAYDVRSWRRWLLDQILDQELHEACEFFELGGEKPFAPNHGPGRDPYTVFEYADDLDRRTSFRGEVNE